MMVPGNQAATAMLSTARISQQNAFSSMEQRLSGQGLSPSTLSTNRRAHSLCRRGPIEIANAGDLPGQIPFSGKLPKESSCVTTTERVRAFAPLRWGPQGLRAGSTTARAGMQAGSPPTAPSALPPCPLRPLARGTGGEKRGSGLVRWAAAACAHTRARRSVSPGPAQRTSR